MLSALLNKTFLSLSPQIKYSVVWYFRLHTYDKMADSVNSLTHQATVVIKTEMPDGWEDKESQTPTLDKLFHCCQCGVDVGTKKELLAHFRQHPGSRLCRCNLCNKEYDTCAKLHLHINSHLGRKDYMCDICGKNFARKSGVVVCDICVTGNK